MACVTCPVIDRVTISPTAAAARLVRQRPWRVAGRPAPPDQRYTGGMSIVFNWNGDDLPDEVRRQMPEELQGLPKGRYVLESVDDAPELTDEDEAGIQAAIDSLRAGQGVSLDAAKARIDRILKR